MLISRLSIAGMVVAAIWVSLSLPASIFDRALLAWTALGAAFGPLVFFRVFGVAVKPAGAFSAVVAGFSTAVLFHFDPGDLTQALFGSAVSPALIERVGSFVVGLGVLVTSRTRNEADR